MDNGLFTLEWDGLAFAKITVAEGTKSCGLCGDNDGNIDCIKMISIILL